MFSGCFGTPPSGVMTLGRFVGMPLAVLDGSVEDDAVLSLDSVTIELGSD